MHRIAPHRRLPIKVSLFARLLRVLGFAIVLMWLDETLGALHSNDIGSVQVCWHGILAQPCSFRRDSALIVLLAVPQPLAPLHQAQIMAPAMLAASIGLVCGCCACVSRRSSRPRSSRPQSSRHSVDSGVGVSFSRREEGDSNRSPTTRQAPTPRQPPSSERQSAAFPSAAMAPQASVDELVFSDSVLWTPMPARGMPGEMPQRTLGTAEP